MKSLGELAMIRDLDYFKRRLLFYFTYAGNIRKKGFPKLDNIIKYGKHDILEQPKYLYIQEKAIKKDMSVINTSTA